MDVKEWERNVLIREYGAIPDQCPTCHASRIIRVVWKPAYCCGGPLGSAIRDEIAILAGDDRPEGAPDWVCPACEPGWQTVYLLTQEVESWQLKKEEALAARDFETAVRHRDCKDEVRRRRLALVNQLMTAHPPAARPAPKVVEPTHEGKTAAEWVGLLREKDLDTRRRAVRALWALGMPAVRPLLNALSDQEASVRALAAVALSGMKRFSPEIAPALQGLLQDPEPLVRQVAVELATSRFGGRSRVL